MARATPIPTASTRRAARPSKRARAVPGEYERHASSVDAACCGVPRGAGDGPVLRRLRELWPVRGLAVGAFGEASADVHLPLAMGAGSGSYLRWRGAMARGPDVHRSQLVVQLRRVWGVHFARVNARLKLARVHSAQGRSLPTAAGRGGCSHTTRAHRDADSNYHRRFGYRSAARTSGRFGGLKCTAFFRAPPPARTHTPPPLSLSSPPETVKCCE